MRDVLKITWHGIHELEIFPGLPDTGGQNIYVQNMAEHIHDREGFRVRILNRGGYVHPYTGRMREGTTKDPNRELYVTHVGDDIPAFVRKEYLTGALIEGAAERVEQEFPEGYRPDLIISHFWDGGLMGDYLCQRFPGVCHIWIPHEPVGMKKAPLSSTERERHSIFIRERYEARVAENADLIGATSLLVRNNLNESYHGRYAHKIIDVYPGVDVDRFYPVFRDAVTGQAAREFADYLGLPAELFMQPHICEFGRSDALKDKDQAVEAFALVAREVDDIIMFLNLDEQMEPEMAKRIHGIIQREGLRDRIHIFSPRELPQTGTGSEILPALMRTSRVFLTMSVMEGFGMAACEAAASGIPVVGTEHIPVVTDTIAPAGGGTVVPGKDPRAAADAVLRYLRMDDEQWNECSRSAYEAVIPRFSWTQIVSGLLEQMKDRGARSA